MGARDLAGARKAEAEDHFRNAEADFGKALGMGLDDGLRYVLLMNRGVLRFQGLRIAEALADFEAAIALDPSGYNAYVSMAHVLAGQGRRAEALGEFDEAIGKFDPTIGRSPALAALYRERARLRSHDDASPAEIALALRDLDEAICREPARGRAAAADHGERGRLLLRLDRPGEALAACEAALAIAPELAPAVRDRVRALLRLERYDQAIGPCDSSLVNGPRSAEIHVLRGLARVGQNQFAGAIDDYTHALDLGPERVSTLLYRGRAYLFANSPELALRDFEEAVRLAPEDPEGYGGRAAAKVRLRRHQEAALDAEDSLRRREPTTERLYDAARTYAQAAEVAASEVARRGRPALRESTAYETRAAELLTRALVKTPVDARMSFWQKYVERDDAMGRLRKRPDLVRRARPAPPP
jgi:tetratricopeptide (TPR) repeat protein